jgi:chromosome segregation protein
VAWPDGATPLAPLIKAPPELAARLSHVAVVARADGDRLAKGLPVGARLVSKEGDLWRWDGFTARADAPKPAAVRLEQRTRLAEVEAEIDQVAPRAEAATAALKTAADALRVAEETLRDKRAAVRPRPNAC